MSIMLFACSQRLLYCLRLWCFSANGASWRLFFPDTLFLPKEDLYYIPFIVCRQFPSDPTKQKAYPVFDLTRPPRFLQ